MAYRSLYARLPLVLAEDEDVVAFGDGRVLGGGRHSSSSYVVLTDRRLLALRGEVEEIPLAAVTRVERVARGGSGVLGFSGGGLVLETAAGEVTVRVRPAGVADAMAEAIAPAGGTTPASGA